MQQLILLFYTAAICLNSGTYLDLNKWAVVKVNNHSAGANERH